jgi:hypothetical protein
LGFRNPELEKVFGQSTISKNRLYCTEIVRSGLKPSPIPDPDSKNSSLMERSATGRNPPPPKPKQRFFKFDQIEKSTCLWKTCATTLFYHAPYPVGGNSVSLSQALWRRIPSSFGPHVSCSWELTSSNGMILFFVFFLAVKNFLLHCRSVFHNRFRGGAADQFVLPLVLAFLEVMWIYCTIATAVRWA